MKLFSSKNRAAHLGPYPLENLKRVEQVNLEGVPPFQPVSFSRPEDPLSIVNAMREYQAMMDAIRDGMVKKETGGNSCKTLPKFARVISRGLDISAMLQWLEFVRHRQVSCLMRDACNQSGYCCVWQKNCGLSKRRHLASGIDVIMAELKEAMGNESMGRR